MKKEKWNWKLFAQQLFAALALVGLLAGLSPEADDHLNKIAVSIDGTTELGDSGASMFAPWDVLEYHHLGVATYVTSRESGELVSVGFVDTVWVLNHSWYDKERREWICANPNDKRTHG